VSFFGKKFSLVFKNSNVSDKKLLVDEWELLLLSGMAT